MGSKLGDAWQSVKVTGADEVLSHILLLNVLFVQEFAERRLGPRLPNGAPALIRIYAHMCVDACAERRLGLSFPAHAPCCFLTHAPCGQRGAVRRHPAWRRYVCGGAEDRPLAAQG